MAIPIETWYYEIPIVTRIYLTLAVLISLGVQTGFIHPLQMYFNYDLIVNDRQYWRLVTNFLFFGPLSLDFLFHMFFLARYSRMLEEGFFRGRTADYFWLLFLSAVQLMCLTPFVNTPFLGSSLSFTLVYIWSRRNPYLRLNMLGILVFSAPYLPWVMLAFSFLLNNSIPTGDLMGIAVGHVYYFFEDVWPQERQSGGTRWLKTPGIVVRLFEGPPSTNDPHLPPLANENQWDPAGRPRGQEGEDGGAGAGPDAGMMAEGMLDNPAPGML